MRNFLIYTLTLGLTISCTVEDVDNTGDISNQNNDKENFELFNTLDSAMDSFGAISEQASVDIQGTSKNFKRSCGIIELLISNQDNTLPGFNTYNHYNKMTLDNTEEQCDFNDWSGEVTYYVAGIFNAKWKDSTIFKNVRGDDGFVFDGYRVAELNEALSNETNKVFDVIINGIITELNGDSYRYTTDRNFTFENRFTEEEIVTLIESSSLDGINQPYFIRTVSVEDEPLVYKVNCFNRLNFLEYPVQGSLDFSSNFNIDFNIDFGDGACDKEVSLTDQNGESIIFDL